MTKPLDLIRLQEEFDYFYCDACGIHVPCRRLESGGWEVMCAGCMGECAFCSCHLRRFCFGTREEFPPLQTEWENGVCRFRPKSVRR